MAKPDGAPAVAIGELAQREPTLLIGKEFAVEARVLLLIAPLSSVVEVRVDETIVSHGLIFCVHVILFVVVVVYVVIGRMTESFL